MKLLQRHNLLFAWIVSAVAMSGSLYFSEVKQFIPCSFCWYQRILMYPLVFLLGRACWKQDSRIIPYVRPLAMIGAVLSLLHYSEQKLGLLSSLTGGACASYAPCSTIYVHWFGFVTIPFMAFCAFMLIVLLLSFNQKPSAD